MEIVKLIFFKWFYYENVKITKTYKKKTPLRCFLIKKKYFEIVFSSIEHTLDIYLFDSVIDVVF
jgi:hypothetical protein